jgi:hypothetical protein
VVFAAGALILWAVALWVSWGGECPTPSPRDGGLDKGISVWPPAAQCLDRSGDPFWHQALPWATWIIAVLIAAAAAILLAGLVAAIRDLRRPAEPASPRAIRLPEPSFGHPGPVGDRPTRDDASRAERDPPAMAA